MKIEVLNILELIVAFTIAFFSAIVLIPIIIKKVKKKNLLDKPNWRSAHAIPTPSFGGISFIPGVLVGVFFISLNFEITLFLICCLILGMVGFLDDLKDLKSSIKFVLQFGVATSLFLAGFRMENLFGFFGIYELSIWLSYGLTIFIVIGVINAFNLIDGIDGLAGGLGLLNTFIFAIIFLIQEDFSFAIVAISFSGSLAGFLKFNFNPAKIFMGDTGSLMLGLFMSAFLLRTFSYNNEILSIIGIAMMLLPSLDMTRLFTVRILKRVSPFKADKNHYHHLLIKAGDSHKIAAMTCYGIALFFVLTGLFMAVNLSFTLAFIGLMGVGVSVYAIIEIKFFFKHRKKQKKLRKQISSMVKNNQLLNELI